VEEKRKTERRCHLRLVSNKVLLALQDSVKHAHDTQSLLPVSRNGALNLLGVEIGEPAVLAVIWALAGHLEVEVLLLEVALRERLGAVANLVLLVVRLDQVLDDGPGLPQCDASVGVLDGWYTPIWVDADEWLLLNLGNVYKDLLGIMSVGLPVKQEEKRLTWLYGRPSSSSIMTTFQGLALLTIATSVCLFVKASCLSAYSGHEE
jgi:hypothetical protein